MILNNRIGFLQVALTCPPALCCGFLYLVSELLKLRPELRQSEANRQLAIQGDGGDDDDDDEEEHYEDADEEPQADATGRSRRSTSNTVRSVFLGQFFLDLHQLVFRSVDQ